MHDGKGRPLTVGDTVMVPAKVTSTSSGLEYCNVTVETVASMYPSDRPTTITFNAKQVIRANEGDDVSYQLVVETNGATSVK
jgi:hypothetical protein